MWAPLAVLLMVVASAFGALDTELPGPVLTLNEWSEAGRELPLDPVSPTPMAASVALPTPVAALVGMMMRVAEARVTSSVFPAPQLRMLDEILVDPIQPATRNPLQTIPGVTLRAVKDGIPGVVGSPKLLSSFAGTPVLPSGRLSFEAGVQIPVFDDHPGMPEPEFLLQFRLQF